MSKIIVHPLADEMIAYKSMLERAGVDSRDIRKMRPIGITVNEVRKFQEACGSDQPPVKAGVTCEIMGVNVIVLHADGDLSA